MSTTQAYPSRGGPHDLALVAERDEDERRPQGNRAERVDVMAAVHRDDSHARRKWRRTAPQCLRLDGGLQPSGRLGLKRKPPGHPRLREFAAQQLVQLGRGEDAPLHDHVADGAPLADRLLGDLAARA